MSRELPVLSVHYGVRVILMVWMTPDEFIIIDDKPGTQAFASSINQVYGYCLAFKDTIKPFKNIIGAKNPAALRQRGTDNIFGQHTSIIRQNQL